MITDGVVSTFCRICEARCGIDVTVADGRVTRIVPDKMNPYTWRDFCMKGRTAHELLEHPRRLRSPLRRDGDRYVEATWDEAIADIAARLSAIADTHGPEAIGAYTGNPIGFNGANGLFFLPFMRAIGSRNVFGVGSVDQNNLHRVCFEMYGRWLVPLVPDVDACHYFLLLGMDPAVSTFGWIHNVPDGWRRTLARRAAGATVVVVDPARTASAGAADEHLAIWPGQDWALLLAIVTIVLREGLERPVTTPPLAGLDVLRALVAEVDVAELAQRCRLPLGVIEDVARAFAAATTAMCVCHTGVSHGGAGVVAEWLGHVLNAITGRLDAPGGRRFERGYIPIGTVSGTRPGPPSRVRGLPPMAGFRSLAELADEIVTPGEGQLRALLCNSGNPVVSGPQGARLDAALAELDLLVGVDLVQRASHRHADWLLPAAHWLEREDLLTIYAHFEDRPFAQLGRAAVTPPPGVWEEWQVWAALAGAMGLELFGGPATAAPAPRDLQRAMVEQGRRITWDQLEANAHGLLYGTPTFGDLHEAIATADGAVRLAPEPFVAELRRLLASPPAGPSAEHPFVLSNRRRRASMNSWLNDLPSARKAGESNVLEMHPDDARDLGLVTGDLAAVESPVGRIELDVLVSDRPQRGVVITEHGWGSTGFDVLGANRNLLTADTSIDELSATPAFSTTCVRVERAG